MGVDSLPDITKMVARSGRQLKEDNTYINTAEMIEAIYNAIVIDKNAGLDVIDRSARALGKITADDAALAQLGALAVAAVTDPTQAASVIAALKGVLTDLGQTSDAAVAAGATGSLSAKIRRLTTDLDVLLVKMGEVQASPTANTILARLKDIKDGIQLTGSILAGAAIQNVTTAGTRVQLPNIPCHEVTVIAKRANTGYIYAGKNTVSSTIYGVELEAKDSFTFNVSNANEVWIDSSVSGEGVSYVAI